MIYLIAALYLGALAAAFINPAGASASKVKLYVFLTLAVALGGSMFFIRGGYFIFAIVTMALAFVGMVYCAKLQKVYGNAQQAAIALLVVILACMVIILSHTMGDGGTRRLIENEMRYAEAAAIVMGRAVAERYPDSRALVIVSDNWEKNSRQQTLVEGIKKGMASGASVVNIDYPKVPKPETPEGMEEGYYYMMEEMALAEHFDELIEANRDCDLIISLIGMPHNIAEMRLWRMGDDSRPKLALMFADVHGLRNAIAAGYLVALSYKPGVKFSEDDAPRDPQEAFEQRYIILTPENVDDIDERYPGYFMQYE